VVGRLNPRTGEMKEWKLDPEAHPHSLINDRAGNIWYMGNGNGTIGRLNPATGEIKVYPSAGPLRGTRPTVDVRGPGSAPADPAFLFGFDADHVRFAAAGELDGVRLVGA
jgi:streptogramin lyase